MSTDAIIEFINSSNANLLAVALGEKNGQTWLLQNHDRLCIPVRVHLGLIAKDRQKAF
jgi:UDP-N-acetyl-D-mannosaminuronic acid transferase (WecB/TagA/CpsF family)